MMITSTGNAKVKQLIQWQKKRKARDEDNVFLAEGLRMASEAPKGQILELYVSESFFERHKEEKWLKEQDRKLTLVSDAVFERVSDTKTPQGVLTVMKRYEYSLDDIVSQKAPLIMVLDNLQDPGNLGTILRAGEAAGVTGLILSQDCVDIYNPKVIRSTMGSIYRMPFVYHENLIEAIEILKKNGIQSFAAHLNGKCSYDKEDYTSGTAFLIGNEGNGLRDEVAEAADTFIRIPMCGEVESLNAAVAASVLMFEAARQRRN